MADINSLDAVGLDFDLDDVEVGAGEADLAAAGISSALDLVTKGLAYKDAKDAAAKGAKDSAAATAAAYDADAAATLARAKALYSEAAGSPSHEADVAASAIADQAQDIAAAGLGPDGQKKRADAARAAVKRATDAWQTASSQKDENKTKVAALAVQAAKVTLAKAENQAIVASGTTVARHDAPSWFTRPVLGPIPGYGVVIGGGVLATAVGFALRAIFKRR